MAYSMVSKEWENFILQSASALFRYNFHIKVFRMLYLHAIPDSSCYISTVPEATDETQDIAFVHFQECPTNEESVM